MKVSYNWLSCFVELPAVEELVDTLIALGFETSGIERKNNDTIIDIEVLVSRQDALSIFGLARDISAFLKKSLKAPEIPYISQNLSLSPQITIEEPLLCPRYTGRIISNIKVSESPLWIKERLLNCGIRPINNIVDITNYVLLELGHPMHSFDYDKLDGGIFVRCGKEGEKLLSLDEREYSLKDCIVISDSKKPIAIGGIIGGEETSVTYETKTILLEVAYFSPIAIRKASKRLGITTESSYRFERGIDPEGLIMAQNRAAGLILELIKDAKIGPISDIYPKPFPPSLIKLREERVNKILGTSLSALEIRDILKSLGFEIDKEFIVRVPSFRQEITREIDLIEEIARIYRYEKIQESIPKSPVIPEINKGFNIIRKIREIMTGCGINEVIAYSFTSKEILNRLGIPLSSIVSLQSPLSSDAEIMTPSIIPALLEVAKTNISRNEENLFIFQIGKVFEKQGEKTSLGALMTGIMRNNWIDKERDCNFFDTLGVIKRLFLELGISYNFIKENLVFAKNGLSVVSNGKTLGIAGVLMEEIAEYYKIKKPVFFFELNLDMLIALTGKKCFKGLSKYPRIEIDLCLVAPDGIKSGEIEEIIKNKSNGLAKGLFLYDIYKGGNIPKNHKSLTYTITYQADDRTLTMDEIEKIRNETLKELKDTLSVSLRS